MKRTDRLIHFSFALLFVLLLAIVYATSAHSEMKCDPPNSLGITSCVNKDVARKQWIANYCAYHARDPNCAALGWTSTARTDVGQQVDEHLVDRFCAANPTFQRCQNPFLYDTPK